MASVFLRNLSKRYDDHTVLHQVNLDIADGEFVVFVGPSGCGKSTLMRAIAGLEAVSDGDIVIGNERVNDVAPAKRGIAMVFQSYALYPHMTLYENMAFGLKLAGAKKAEIDAAVKQAASILHIDHLLDRKPKQLSGGQRQRVAIGRAITRKPKVFLFDEPLSNLDAALRVKMRLEFARLHDELKTTMIYVTHDQVEAMTLADKIVVMQAGRIEQVGSPYELYHAPVNRFVAGFIGSPKMNFLDGIVQSVAADSVTVRYGTGETQRVAVDAGRAREGDRVTVGVRPEHFAIGMGHAGVSGRVTAVESLGDTAYLYVESDAAAEQLVVKVSSGDRFEKGATFAVGALAEHCHLFDERGEAFRRTSNALSVAASAERRLAAA